jgi:hypothetical protein
MNLREYTERNAALTEIERLRAKNEKLLAALRRIVAEADSDDGLTAWDGADIARNALKE